MFEPNIADNDENNNTIHDTTQPIAHATFTLPWSFFKKYLVQGKRRLAKGWTYEFNFNDEKVFACASCYSSHDVYYDHVLKRKNIPFSAAAKCKSIEKPCCSFQFQIFQDTVKDMDSTVRVTRTGRYNQTDHEVVRRFITDQQRQALAHQLLIDSPSIVRLQCLTSADERLLKGGNRNAAPSTMLLQKKAVNFNAKYT